MSDKVEREHEHERGPASTTPSGSPQEQPNVDAGRRAFTRLGATGTPVLMTLASRPVFGANCLSNALSGNLSDPDRGNCSFGMPADGVANIATWGPLDPDATYLEETRLSGYLPPTLYASEPETLRSAIMGSDRSKRVIVAAWANTMVTAGYILTEEQLFQLLDGSLPVPGDLPLVDYLESTMQY